MLSDTPLVWLAAASLTALLMATTAEPAPPGKMLQREISGELPLVKDGQPAVTIVAPDPPDMVALGADLSNAVLELTGCRVPVISGTETVEPDGRSLKPEFRNQHLILLGNALTNPAILPLYCRWLDAADGAYPGEDGYELRTVVNPYGTGCHELIVGASTPDGLRRGVAAIKDKLAAAVGDGSLTLPQLLEVQVGPRLQPTFDQAVAAVKANPERKIGPVLTNGDLAELCNDGLRYAWTGERTFAQRAAGILREMNRRFDGSYYHGDIRTCDDYALEYAVRGWLVLQHAGVLSPEELLETDLNLYKDFPYSAHGPGSVGSRHLASGSMAWFLALDGLLTYGNPDPEAKAQLVTWREGVRAYFQDACKTYRGDVDQAQDFGAMENVFRYAIHDGYWEYFTSGWADRTITQMLMNVDNQGWYSGLGGYGESMPGSLNYPVAIGICLPITAFVEQRGDLRWIKENVPNLGWVHLGFQVLGVHAFEMGGYVPASAPQGELTGLTLLPLSEYHWNLGQRSITDGIGPVTTALERCVDKIMLREGFGKNDQYLLLNGYQNTVMGCVDGNAIVRFCDQGQVLLFQSTQEEGHDTKNAVWVSNGRSDDLLEGCVEKGPMADLDHVCFTSATLPRYHGTDWERNLFWRKGGALVVMDRVTVKEPGPYVMACTWRSPRYARLTDEGRWEARTGAGSFRVSPARPANAPPPQTVTEGRDGQTAMQWSPDMRLTSSRGNDHFSAEVPWVLQEWRRFEGKPGQVVDFQNLVGLNLASADSNADLLRLSDRAVLLRLPPAEADGPAGHLSVLTRGPQRVGDGLVVGADFAWLGDREANLAGMTELSREVDGLSLTSTAPVDMVLERKGASVSGWVRADTACELTVRAPGLRSVSVGAAPTPATEERVRIALTPGRHELRLNGAASGLFGSLEGLLIYLGESSTWVAAPALPESPRSGDDPLRTVWSFGGLRSLGQRERNLTVSSRAGDGEWQPGPYAVLSDTYFHHSISSDSGGGTWKADKVDLQFDLPDEQTVVALRIHTYCGATDVAAVKPNPATVAGVALSSDGFQNDMRLSDRPVARRYQYLRGCYGGAFFGEVVDEVLGLRESATALRLTLTKPEGVADIRVGRVELLVAGPGDSTPLKAQAIRWGKDNSPCFAVWSPDRGHLCILGAAGKLVWERDLAAGITGVSCDDVDGDGLNELVVCAADWRLRLFDSAGTERVVKDWRGLYDETGGKYYYGGTPHGVGPLAVAGQKAKDLMVGQYYFLTSLGLDGKIGNTYEGTACYWQDFLDCGLDLSGDGINDLLVYSETPWQTKVSVVAVDSKTREPLFSFPAGNGGARIFQTLRVGDEDCVAVGSHKGCGIYSLTRRAYKWYLGGEVFRSSFFLTDPEGDGSPEMLIGQRDGFVLALDMSGKIVRQMDVGEEVLAVGEIETPAGRMVLASTERGTRCFDTAGNSTGTLGLVAQRFEPTTHEGNPALLALGVDGEVGLVAAQ